MFMLVKRVKFQNKGGHSGTMPFGIMIIKFQETTEIEVIKSW